MPVSTACTDKQKWMFMDHLEMAGTWKYIAEMLFKVIFQVFVSWHGGWGQKKGEKVTQAGLVVYVSLCQGEDFFFYWCSFRQTDSAMVQYYLFAERFAFWLIVYIKHSTAFTIKHSTTQSDKELKNHSKVKCRNITQWQYMCIHTHTHARIHTHM